MRHFHRPAEIVIGYDEAVFAPDAVRRLRDAWARASGRPVRTMPFLRASRDDPPTLLLTFGDFAEAGEAIEFLDGVASSAWRDAREAAAAVIGSAGEAGPQVQVRFDVGPVIVRGAAPVRSADEARAALLTLRHAARRLADLLPGLSPEMRLVMLELRGGEWAPVQARGYRASGPVIVDLEDPE